MEEDRCIEQRNDNGLLADVERIDDSYSQAAGLFARWCRENGHGFTLEAIRAYVKVLNKSGYAASTIGVHRAGIKRRVKQIIAPRMTLRERADLEQALRELDTDPATKGPKLATTAVGTDKLISAEEYQRLREAATERQGLFIEFLYATGCRVSEMIGVELSDCTDTGTGSVRVRIMGKGLKERFVMIPASLYAEIRQTFRGDRWLFETISRRQYTRGHVGKLVASLGRRVLGRRISPHYFRHTFITRIIHQTGKFRAVSRYVGHSSVASTMDSYLQETLSFDEIMMGRGDGAVTR